MLGSPISHSLSPALHRAAYAALGLTGWRYDAIECDEAGLAELLQGSAPEVRGYSCTMPLKRVLLQVADSVSATARDIGAANTLVRSALGWHAENTDWFGVRAALAETGLADAPSVVILGAGGTAQAALAAMTNSQRVTALVRDRSRADGLLAAAARLGRDVRVSDFADEAALRDADLVISTLPGTAADQLANRDWRPGQGVLDVVYHPWPTRLAAQAGAAGARVASGALMLLHQAARQVELMTGSTAPVEAMRAALRQAAPGCGV